VLRDFPVPRDPLELRAARDGEEMLAQEDPTDRRAPLGSEDLRDPKDREEIKVTWETMGREVRRATVASPGCRVFLDLLAQQVSKERQVSSDQVAKGGPPGRLDLQERKGIWDHQDLWDLPVHED